MRPGDRLLLSAGTRRDDRDLCAARRARHGQRQQRRPQGVATLAGAGVARYRTAILWGTVTTLVGALCFAGAGQQARRAAFHGHRVGHPRSHLRAGRPGGAGAWVALATATRLPVSTTHALIGALIGAGLLLSVSSVQFAVLATRVARPLLASIAVAYLLSLSLSLHRLGDFRRDPGLPRACQPPAPALGGQRPALALQRDHQLRSRPQRHAQDRRNRGVRAGACRMSTTGVLLTVALAMALGSVAGGLRVARRLVRA